jgi:hypothetical protein
MAVKPHFFATSLLEASELIKKQVDEKWKYSLIQQI